MSTISRRAFLECLGAASALTLIGRELLPAQQPAVADLLRMLVVGDSFVWGQGLEEKDKFYSLTKDWLEREAFGTARAVEMKVKAHSGATIKFHADETEAFRKVGRSETDDYPPEINVGFPSIRKQLEVAADEYQRDGGAPNLIMLCGGITDISVAKLLDPFGNDKVLPDLIKKYCYDDMFELLEQVTIMFPCALIAVVGYYPIVSPKTSAGKLFNSWLESMGFSRPLKPLVNNRVTRSLVFRKIYKKAIKRSRIWFEESNKQTGAAISRINKAAGITRAVFIKSPITEDNCLETPDTMLFRMTKKGRTEDGLYDYRVTECPNHLGDLAKKTGLKYSVRYCEIAAVGHPNPAGSRAYAESIKAALRPLLTAAPK